MALPLVGTSSGDYTSSTSLATSLPGGTLQKGDVLHLVIEFPYDDVVTEATASGWTKGGAVYGPSAGWCVVEFLATYDPAGVDGVSSAAVVTWGGDSKSHNWVMTAWRGYRLPADTSAATPDTAQTAAPTLPAVTTTVDDDLVIGTAATFSGGAFTAGSGLTLAGSDGYGNHTLYKVAGAAGSTGTMASSCARSTWWLTTTTALKPVDTTAPGVTLTGTVTTRISRVAGKDASSFFVTADEEFVEYDLRAVPGTSSPRTAGDRIETGTMAATTSQAVTVTDDELIAAVGSSEDTYIIKAFVKDAAGNWSD